MSAPRSRSWRGIARHPSKDAGTRTCSGCGGGKPLAQFRYRFPKRRAAAAAAGEPTPETEERRAVCRACEDERRPAPPGTDATEREYRLLRREKYRHLLRGMDARGLEEVRMAATDGPFGSVVLTRGEVERLAELPVGDDCRKPMPPRALGR